MKMNKMFAGLVALVAGMALSAGSAFATAGYVGGDPSMNKLVPYFETGDSKATIIGIKNMSPQETVTMGLNADVASLMAYIGGTAADANVVRLMTSVTAEGDMLEADELDQMAEAEAALEKAREDAYVEHLFISVNVYDAMGMMMGSTVLCLEEHEFGYVVLQGPADTGTDTMKSAVLSVMDEDIPPYGFVKILAEDRKFTGCGATAPNSLMTVDTRETAAGTARTDMAQSMVGAWTIIQDVGDGFFGTEVVTSTISLEMAPGNSNATPRVPEGDPELACYSSTEGAPDTDNPAGVASNLTGAFMMPRCGLIPERHMMGALNVDTTTVNAHAVARYDSMDDSLVVLWLAKGDDAKTMARPRDSRTVDVDIACEDGTLITMMEDQFGDMQPITIAAPNMLTMIDPNGDELGMHTAMCDGDRGSLIFTMPNGSHAGMVFSHITQAEGQFRMNFVGYGKAADGVMADGNTAEPRERCTTTSADVCR